MSTHPIRRRTFVLRLAAGSATVVAVGLPGLAHAQPHFSKSSKSEKCKRAEARLAAARKELRAASAAERKAIAAQKRAEIRWKAGLKKIDTAKERREKARRAWDEARKSGSSSQAAKKRALDRATDQYIIAKKNRDPLFRALRKAERELPAAIGRRKRADREFRRAFDARDKACKPTLLPKTGLTFGKRPPPPVVTEAD